MTPLQVRLLILYGFLAAVAGLSVAHIWSLQTNPFVSYLGAGRWFELCLDVGAIAVSALTGRALLRRAKEGPRFALLLACAVLLGYLGNKMLLVALLKTVPFYRVLGVEAIVMSLLAVVVVVVLRTKSFVDGYARGL